MFDQQYPTLVNLRFAVRINRRAQMLKKLNDYVQTAEAAEILGDAHHTPRKWAKRGEMPMHRHPVNGYR